MSYDFTGATVSSTYGRLVQVVHGTPDLYYDGFGNLLNLGPGTSSIGTQGPTGPSGTSMIFQGEWDSMMMYFYYDFVTYNGDAYLCISNLSGTSPWTSPDLDTTHWERMLIGISGTSGTSGLNGTSGINGTSGENGTSGTSGINGLDGTSGINGTSGTSGTGENGTSGSSGQNGVNGTSGSSGVSGQSSTLYKYKTNTNIITGDPGIGNIIWNNLSQSISSQINISHITSDSLDIDVFLSLLSIGQTLIIQDELNSNNYQKWSISSNPTLITNTNNYWMVPVSLISSGGTGTTNFSNNKQILIAILSPAGSSGISGSSGTSGQNGSSGTSGQNGAGGALGYYGSFYDMTDQLNLTASTPRAWTYDSTYESNGISIIDNSKIKFNNPGTYNIQFSTVFSKTSANAGEVDIWFSKNGNYISNSNTLFNVAGQANTVASWNFIQTVNSNDYIEIYWQSDDTSISLNHTDILSNPDRPATPSIILTAQQIMYTQLGATGSNGTSGINGLDGTSGSSGASGTSGENGTSGTSGINGLDGTSGENGTSGTSGINGLDGTSGTSGINGLDGTSGTSGINGLDGTSGTSGINGLDGTSGENGTSGTSGENGTSGTSGINGLDGTSGTSGINGLDGTSGTSGINGLDGTSGENGTSGTSGINGLDGTSGTSGTSGINGLDGTSGTSGTSGINGLDGTSGTSGINGLDGTSGTSGINGLDGTSGTSGINGLDGTSGTSGINGLDGTSGTSGENGTSGTSGVNGLDGTSGTSGINGLDGSSGTSGTSGINGTSGIDGTSGTSGTSGASGENGTSGTSGVNGLDGTYGTSGTSGTSGENGTSGTSGINGLDGTSGTSGTSGLLNLIGNTNNGIITLDGTSPNGKVESNLTFDGSLLNVSGQIIASGSTTDDLVRITQVGSGNALVVEDSNNPDSTPFVVSGNGNVGIGTTAPVAPLNISDGNIVSTSLYTSDYLIVSAQNTAPGFNIVSAGSGFGNRGVFKATRSRGTLSSPTVPLQNDQTFSLLGAIYDGVGNFASAAINFDVDGTVSAGVYPQRMSFWTGTGSYNGGAVRQERMRIDSVGNVGIGTTSPSTKLHINSSTKGALRIVDGTQGNGYYLVSDTNGVASWTASVYGSSGTSGTSGLLSLSGTTDNGVVTLNGSSPNATVEPNLTFDGSNLNINGNLTMSGTVSGNSNNSISIDTLIQTSLLYLSNNL